jgi:hypothetical protein
MSRQAKWLLASNEWLCCTDSVKYSYNTGFDVTAASGSEFIPFHIREHLTFPYNVKACVRPVTCFQYISLSGAEAFSSVHFARAPGRLLLFVPTERSSTRQEWHKEQSVEAHSTWEQQTRHLCRGFFFWESKSSLKYQEMLCLLRNPKVNYSVYKNPSLHSILNQLSQIHRLRHHVIEITRNFNIQKVKLSP